MFSNRKYFIAAKVGEGHVTLVWLGMRTEKELQDIINELSGIITKLPCFKFDEWKTLGKPEEIKNGKGLKARTCHIENIEKWESSFLPFYRKWYFHEQGEAEERKLSPTFHMTIGKMKEEEIAKLDALKAVNVYIKQAGGEVIHELKPSCSDEKKKESFNLRG